MAQLQFSDTTNKDGIVQKIQDACGLISATTNTYPLKRITKDVNSALDNYFDMANEESPHIKIDDTNHSSEPAFTINLVSGTKRYTFNTDANSNQILKIDRIDILRADGTSKRLSMFNRADIEDTGMASYNATSGEPESYFIEGEEIVLDRAPNYNSTNGLKLFDTRTPSYFTSTDTTKVAGIPNIHHDYLWVRPSFFWCILKDKKRAAGLKILLDDLEKRIRQYYKSLSKDSTKTNAVQRMKPKYQNNK